MHVSDARRLANQQNALKSTGPKTDEGKAISRRNGLKHGLTGQGIVAAQADDAEIERRVEALEKDMKPVSPNGVALIRVMAVASVAMEKASQQLSAAQAKSVRHAVADHDEAMLDEADTLFEGLDEDPRKNLRKLKRTPEGVDRLIEAWEDLRDELARAVPSGWTAEHLDRITLLTGKPTATAWSSRLGALSRALGYDFLGLSQGDGAGLDDDARADWARERLAERIATEIEALQDHRETLDLEAFEQDRVEAPARALFDTSKPATLARRYEAEACRRYFKALAEFRKVEAESLEKSTWEDMPSSPPTMGSSGDYGPPSGYERMMAELEANPDAVDVVRGPDGKPLVATQRPISTR
jgi:hypothetical protein